jgi:hypothetical protein
MNWGECYFDHFARYFRDPVAREVFAQGPEEHTIQVLAYDKVFEGCRLFASLGLSHYAEDVGQVAEIFVPADDGWDVVPGLVANALFYMVQKEIHIGWGVAVGGLDKVDPVFTRRFGKQALYLTNAYGLPEGSGEVLCNGLRGSLYLGLFLADAEYRLFLDEGAKGLEKALESKQVDPYHVARASIV